MEINKTLEISELMIQRFECEYPCLNVRQEIRNMQNWWLANPRKRKSNEYKFVVNWLNASYAKVVVAEVKAREGYRNASVGSAGRDPTPEQVAEYKRNIAEILREHPELA